MITKTPKHTYLFLRENPFISLLFPLLIGITMGIYFSFYISIFIPITLLIVLFIFPNNHITLRIIWSGIFYIFWIIMGMYLVQNKKHKTQPPKNLSEHYIQAIIRETPQQKKNSTVIPLEIIRIKQEKKIKKCSFFVIGYLPKEKQFRKLQYGDTIFTKMSFSPIKHNTNPYAFDYAKLMSIRQFHYNGYTHKSPILQSTATHFSILRTAKQTQKHLCKIVRKHIKDNKVCEFLQAMTLGNKKELSITTKTDFVNTGVIHILAVSGLHVGILFLIINFLLQPFATNNSRRIFTTLIGLSTIWAFAFISGLSISVIRASIMFSGLQLSLLSLRPYKVYNTISYSAVLLLLYNPFNILEVGFQLSYIAVIGIITFVPILNKHPFKNRITQKLRELVSVSLIAQLSILPISLYHFHHLPTYFLLANIVVLSLAPILLGGTLLILVISKIPFLVNALSVMVSYLGKLCLISVNTISKFPFPILIEYSPQPLEVFIWCAIIWIGYFYYKYRKITLWYSFLFLIIISIITFQIDEIKCSRQESFIVHNTPKTSCYQILSGKQSVVIHSDSLLPCIEKNTLLPIWIKRKIKNITVCTKDNPIFEVNNISRYNNQYKIGNKHIVLAKNTEISSFTKDKTTIDYLIFSKQCTNTNILNICLPKLIIIDSSLTPWQNKELYKKLKYRKIPIHNVATMGAFIIDIQ